MEDLWVAVNFIRELFFLEIDCVSAAATAAGVERSFVILNHLTFVYLYSRCYLSLCVLFSFVFIAELLYSSLLPLSDVSRAQLYDLDATIYTVIHTYTIPWCK